MAPHSSTLAWKILWMEEPGRLQSMGSLRVGPTERLHFHFSLSCVGKGNGNPLMFLPGESQEWGSLVGCRLWGCTEQDTTEVTQQQQQMLRKLLFFHWVLGCVRLYVSSLKRKLQFFTALWVPWILPLSLFLARHFGAPLSSGVPRCQGV